MGRGRKKKHRNKGKCQKGLETMIMGIDHGYYAIKSRNFSFPAGVTAYTHEPYTLKNTLQIGGKYFVCGTGRQPILRDKTVNDNYYILTLAAIAMELRYRGFPAESSVTLAAGLPLARYPDHRCNSGNACRGTPVCGSERRPRCHGHRPMPDRKAKWWNQKTQARSIWCPDRRQDPPIDAERMPSLTRLDR